MPLTRGQSLERVKLAWSRSPLPDFLRWWRDELVALLPVRARHFVQRGPDVLWLSVDSTRVDARRVHTGPVLATIAGELPVDVQRATFGKACAGTDPDDRRLVLVVAEDSVLYRRLLLPVAAAADPRKVVGYELDRQTPFRADQVYYDVRVSTAPAPAGQVVLELYVVPKTELDPMLERLAQMGAHPDAVDVQDAQGRLVGVDLLPPGRKPRRVDRRQRFNWALLGACVVLLALVLGQWLGNRRAALVAMQDQVAAMRTQATQSERLRAELVAATAASKFLLQRRAQNPPPLLVLRELTQRLPASAWLQTLTLDDSGGVDMKGEAAHAAALIDTFAASKLLGEPKLQGVIQPDAKTGKERFELVARIRQGAPADAH